MIGQKVQVGEIVVFSGTPHMISTIERSELGTLIARAADGWGISLTADGVLCIPNPNERWCLIRRSQA